MAFTKGIQIPVPSEGGGVEQVGEPKRMPFPIDQIEENYVMVVPLMVAVSV